MLKEVKILNKVSKCKVDCKNCFYCNVKCADSGNNIVYGIFCEYTDKNGYSVYSNTFSGLKNKIIECMKFELS